MGFRVFDWPDPRQSQIKGTLEALTIGRRQHWDSVISEMRPDLLHLNNIHPHLGPAFLRWIITKSIPAVMTIHNHRFYCSNGLALYKEMICKICKTKASLLRPIIFNCNQKLSRSAYHAFSLAEIRSLNLLNRAVRGFIAPTDYIACELRESGISSDKIWTIPHSVEGSSLTTEQKEQKYDVVFAGRLSKEKGIDRLLRLAEMRPNLKFAIAGAGPNEADVRSAALSNKNLSYLGRLSQLEALTAIQQSKVACVLSACEEAFSYFSVESLLLGTQVVVPPNASMNWLSKLPFPAIQATENNDQSFCSAMDLALSLGKPLHSDLEKTKSIFSVDRYCELLNEKISSIFLPPHPREL